MLLLLTCVDFLNTFFDEMCRFTVLSCTLWQLYIFYILPLHHAAKNNCIPRPFRFVTKLAMFFSLGCPLKMLQIRFHKMARKLKGNQPRTGFTKKMSIHPVLWIDVMPIIISQWNGT
jgi:hypothetical protein